MANIKNKMAKIRVAVGILLLACMISLLFYKMNKMQPIYDNKGKKALINGKDTCIIISEDQNYTFRAHPKETTVMYKDNYGKYVEQSFQSDMITIIDEKK
jgi:hypothetical protein